MTGAGNGWATTNLMNVDVNPVLDKAADETLKNGLNNICQQYEDCDRLKSFTITMEFCTLEPDALHLAVGGSIITGTGPGAGKTLGLQYPLPTDSCGNGISVEFWQLAWDGDAQATSSLFAGTSLTYLHHVYPKVLFQIADIKGDTKFTTWKIVGQARINPKITANGPFDDWPAGVVNAGGVTGLGGWFYDTALPAGACAPIAIPSAAS